MNVSVENLAPCKKLLRIEVGAEDVLSSFEDVTRQFCKMANLPGFRPGKAPRAVVEKNYGDRIRDEVKKKLTQDAYEKAMTQEKLRAAVYPDIEEIQFSKELAYQFAATVEVQPEFELPDYKGLKVERESRVIGDEDVDKALNTLLEQRVDYTDVDRPLQRGDIAVVNYQGTVDGKPITELAPTARGITEQKNFWVRAESDQFIPGFADQLIDAKAGDKRTVEVTFPEDFVTPALVGLKGSYEVELVQVKERVLPTVDDEFAESFGAESLEKLKEGIRTDLENDLKFKQNRSVRDQLVKALMDRVQIDLPESVVAAETRSVVYDLVAENQRRGLSKEVIEKQKDEIFTAANANAKEKVKAMYIMGKIAEKEGVKVDQKEIVSRVAMMAQQYQMPPEKLAKQLQERNGFNEIHEQIMVGKVLDFLQLNAEISEVPASA
ncbi:MAG: trigger factor [Verrucomicrobiae bacterium]|nr:trigger factor [Verrucomicrobiae bacterium]